MDGGPRCDARFVVVVVVVVVAATTAPVCQLGYPKQFVWPFVDVVAKHACHIDSKLFILLGTHIWLLALFRGCAPTARA